MNKCFRPIYNVTLTAQVRYTSLKKPNTLEGSVNKSLIDVLQTTQKRLGVIQVTPKRNSVVKSPLLKDIAYIVNREPKEPNVMLDRVDQMKLKLGELSTKISTLTAEGPTFPDVRTSYKRKLLQWRKRSVILTQVFKDENIDELIRPFSYPENEPLVHLGRAVLLSSIQKYLLDNLSNVDAGDLIFAQEQFVSTHILTQFAISIELTKFYLVKDPRKKMDEDVSLALIGAIHLKDPGSARSFISQVFLPRTLFMLPHMNEPDHFARIEKEVVKKYHTKPEYIVLEEQKSWFVVALQVEEKILAVGYGTTLEIARLNVAKSAMCTVNFF